MRKGCWAVLGILVASLAVAQDENQRRIGGQLAYGTEIESPGIGVNAEFPIPSVSRLTIAPNFIYYFPKNSSFVRTTLWELNANVNYYFTTGGSVGFYALGGLNFTSIKVKTDLSSIGFGEFTGSDSSIGLNVGAGATFSLGKNFLPFTEIKYTLGDFDQLVLAAGLRFNF